MATESDKAELLELYRKMYRAMLAARTAELGALLDEAYVLTHITGYRQPKREWLAAIQSGQMRYHSAEEKLVDIQLRGDQAVLVGKSKVDATIYGGRATWNLQLTTEYARRDGSWIALRTAATTF